MLKELFQMEILREMFHYNCFHYISTGISELFLVENPPGKYITDEKNFSTDEDLNCFL